MVTWIFKLILELRFRKNLAKLKGSAVRIKSKKLKGKKKRWKKKKNGSCHAGIWTRIPTSSSEKRAASNHWAMRSLHPLPMKINNLEVSFSAIHTVLSVLNLPRQGFPATCPVGHCCVCNPWLFASEIFCDLPTYNKQRMNKMSTSLYTCCLETQNARWRHVEWRL